MHATLRPILRPHAFKGLAISLGLALSLGAHAAVPGITSANGATVRTSQATTFNISAGEMVSNQPDGRAVYSWGYGCQVVPDQTAFVPFVGTCPTAQMPGPTLVVHEGDTVTVTLTNNLPAAAGATSILFPGFTLASTSGGAQGLLTQEAPNASCNPTANAGCNTVTYTFVANTPGTHAYYSGTQGTVQVEMGLFGALIVLPKVTPAACTSGYYPTQNDAARSSNGETDFRLEQRHAAYNHPQACYDREYLLQTSEIDLQIHTQVQDQVAANAGCVSQAGCLNVVTEPYIPSYYLLNGRSMPDDLDPNYAPAYPNQPYNANPHVHPGELMLVRIIGQGRWQHPFHEHANHLRLLARDGNLLLGAPDANGNAPLAGPLLFTTTTTPGMALDAIFTWTAKGLNWDVFGHAAGILNATTQTEDVCIPDANGYYTSNAAAPNYFEWCGDHHKALERYPTGQVASGGPMTLPEPNTVVNGAWYSGSPYLGAEANIRSVGVTPIPPAGTVLNDPGKEAGYAFMWHSHNEREITTSNVFPGGIMTMLLVDSRGYKIDETQ